MNWGNFWSYFVSLFQSLRDKGRNYIETFILQSAGNGGSGSGSHGGGGGGVLINGDGPSGTSYNGKGFGGGGGNGYHGNPGVVIFEFV